MPKNATNGKRLTTPSSANAAVKSICDIMRRSNCAGALQYVPELTWLLFLRILDERETREAEQAEAVGAEFTHSLEAPYRWQDWAAKSGSKRTELQNGALGAFFGFVNGELLPHLRGLRERPNAAPRQKIISEILSGVERIRIDTERKLLDDCDLWAIVSLPGGAFVNGGAGVKTNLLFFIRGRQTERIWYYDLSDIKVGKKTPLTQAHFEEFFNLLPGRADSEHSWTVTRAEIEARGYDLKAVNPNRKVDVDERTPQQILEAIEAKGREVAEALAALKR